MLLDGAREMLDETEISVRATGEWRKAVRLAQEHILKVDAVAARQQSLFDTDSVT